MMSFSTETDDQQKQIKTIVKELNSLTSLLQSYQKEKCHLNMNKSLAHAQTYAPSLSRTFNKHSASKHVPFTVSANVSNNFQKMPRQVPQQTLYAKNPNAYNKLSYVRKNAPFSGTKYSLNLSSQIIPKSSVYYPVKGLSNGCASTNKGINSINKFPSKNFSSNISGNTLALQSKKLAELEKCLLKHVQKDRKCIVAHDTAPSVITKMSNELECPLKKFSKTSASIDFTFNEKSELNGLELERSTSLEVVDKCDIKEQSVQSQSDGQKILEEHANKSDSETSCTSEKQCQESSNLLCDSSVKLLSEEVLNTEVNSKVVISKPKRMVNSKYKVINKNSPVVKKLNEVSNKKVVGLSTVRTPNGKSFLHQKNCFSLRTSSIPFKTPNKTRFSLKKKSPGLKVKKIVCSKFKVVNKNGSFTLKSKTPAKSTLKAHTARNTPLFPKTGKLSSNKYKVINKNKTIIKGSSKSYLMCMPKNSKVLNSKYKVVNDKKSFVESMWDLENGTFEEVSLKATPVSKPTSVDKIESSSKEEKKACSSLVKQKINRLKFIKIADYEGYDLTDLSPDELIDMDTDSLLKLSKLLKSSDNKRHSFIKKSKYKIVSKQPSLSKQAAKMIKAKYQVKSKQNKRRSWSALHSCQGPLRNLTHVKNGYQKHTAFRSAFKGYSSKNNRYKKTNFVVIGDIAYRTSRTKLTKAAKKSRTPKRVHERKCSRVIIVRGERFKMDPSGKSLRKLSGSKCTKTPVRRIDLGGRTYVRAGQGILKETATPQIRNLASRVLHKSIQTVWASAAKKKELTKSNVYCMFFNRFGKCNRGTSCPYVHDPSKIAVCTRFLRGTCKVDNCPFSHEKAPGKMAICSFFLQGLCKNQECPYRHEELNPDVKLCKAFVRGYCCLGVKCKKAHILVCPQYIQGNCKNGASCPYPHPPQRERKPDRPSKTVAKDRQSDCKKEELPKEVSNEKEEESDDEDFRYFKFFLPTEARGKKRKATEDDEEKCKDILCRPQRNKLLELPFFIPLS